MNKLGRSWLMLGVDETAWLCELLWHEEGDMEELEEGERGTLFESLLLLFCK